MSISPNIGGLSKHDTLYSKRLQIKDFKPPFVRSHPKKSSTQKTLQLLGIVGISERVRVGDVSLIHKSGQILIHGVHSQSGSRLHDPFYLGCLSLSDTISNRGICDQNLGRHHPATAR